MPSKESEKNKNTGRDEATNPEEDAGDPKDPTLVKLTHEMVEEVEYNLALRSPQEANWDRWHQVYDGNPRVEKKDHPWPGASNIVVNISAVYTESITARLMQGLFQVDPHWIIEPLGNQGEPVAKPLERFLDQARRNVWNQERVVKPAVLDLIKLGTCVIHNGWIDQQMWRTDPDTRARVDAGRLFGPRPMWVPRPDFLIPLGFNKINDAEDGPKAPWVAYRQYFSRTALQTLEFNGFLVGTDKILQTPDEINENRKRYLERSTEQMSTGGTPATDLYELWSVYFTKDLDGDGYPEEYVVVIHLQSKSLLRFRPNPYVNSFRPFVSCPFIEIEGQFDGIGVPQAVEMYQEEISTIHNQRRDNSTLANTLTLKVRKGALTDRLKARPGGIIPLNDPNDLQELRFGQNYMTTIQEEQVAVGMAERRVGISDLNLGRESSPIGRAAATTVMNLLQEGARKFDLNVSELRRMLAEQALQIIELYQTHGLPKAGEAGSPEQFLDPEPAALVRALLESKERVRGLIGLKVNASTPNAMNRQQVNLQLFQMAQQYIGSVIQNMPLFLNPQIPTEAKQAIVRMIKGADSQLKEVFDSENAFNLEQILIGEELEQLLVQQDQQQQMMAQQQAMQPQPPPGPQGNGKAAPSQGPIPQPGPPGSLLPAPGMPPLGPGGPPK